MVQRTLSELAAAYVRGMARQGALALPEALTAPPLASLDADGRADIARLGEEAGLRMYYFKEKERLPRVKKVLGFLRAVRPESLLDVGSGRGVFLFPFLCDFPDTPVTALDLLEYRTALHAALAAGGIGELTPHNGDITRWDAPDASFDVVTLLEVLEHIPDVQKAVDNAVRLARRYVVVTVPSKPDDNPEHIHLLTKERLTDLFAHAGVKRLQFDGVRGHLFLTAAKQE